MAKPDSAKDIPAMKRAIRKMENNHDSNPAMRQLKEVLLKRIDDLEESARQQQK